LLWTSGSISFLALLTKGYYVFFSKNKNNYALAGLGFTAVAMGLLAGHAYPYYTYWSQDTERAEKLKEALSKLKEEDLQNSKS